MAKKTATLLEPPANADESVLDNVTQDSLALFAQVDAMLLDFVRGGGTGEGQLSGAQLLACRRMAWDRDEIRRQIAYRVEIVKYQAMAGTAAEREAARQQLQAATEKLATEGAKLRNELESVTARLTAQIAAMETEVTKASTLVNTHTRSVTNLRGRAPAHIVHDSHRTIQLAGEPHRVRANALQAEIGIIETASQIKFYDPGSKHQLARYCENHAPECLSGERAQGHHPWRVMDGPKVVIEVKWKEHVAAQMQRLPELRRQLREAQAAEVAATKQAEIESLSYYVPQ